MPILCLFWVFPKQVIQDTEWFIISLLMFLKTSTERTRLSHESAHNTIRSLNNGISPRILNNTKGSLMNFCTGIVNLWRSQFVFLRLLAFKLFFSYHKNSNIHLAEAANKMTSCRPFHNTVTRKRCHQSRRQVDSDVTLVSRVEIHT